MPVQVNPFIRTDADEATTLAESLDTVGMQAPVSSDEPIVSAEQVGQSAAEAAQQAAVEQFWQINRSNPVPDFQRLLSESPEFANKYNADVGRKAKRKYEPEIEKAQAEAEALRIQLQQERFATAVSRMSQVQVQQRLAGDPQFAQQYHNRQQVPNVAAQSEQIEWSRAVSSVIDDGIGAGLPEQTEAAIRDAIGKGQYDYEYDPRTGAALRPLSPQEAVLALQRDVVQAVNYWRAQNQRPAQPAPTAAPLQAAPQQAAPPQRPIGLANPALQQGADLSGGMTGGRASPRISRSEVSQMRHADFKAYMERWPTQQDYIRDIQNGIITED